MLIFFEARTGKSYRKRSLLIHPDKLRDHPRGIEAFDLLKKAEGFLLDADKRKSVPILASSAPSMVLMGLLVTGRELDQTIKDARILVLRSLKVPDTAPDDHPKLVSLSPSLGDRIRVKTKELMIEEELRVRKCACVALSHLCHTTRKFLAEHEDVVLLLQG